MNGQVVAEHRTRQIWAPVEKRSEQGNALDDALHHLAQPLTALMFIIELGRLQPNAELWKASLDSAGDECRRAVEALQQVRQAAAGMTQHFKEEA